MATQANAKSKKYLKWERNLTAIPCPKLVPLIESGENELAVDLIIKEYLAGQNLEKAKVILGCTHYALLEKEIKLKLDTEIINPAKELYEIFRLENISQYLNDKTSKSKFRINAYSTSLNSPLTVAIKELTRSLDI